MCVVLPSQAATALQKQHILSKPRCVTLSLGLILVDCAVDGAIAITHGNCNGNNEDGHVGVRRAVKSGGYCVAKATPPIKSFALRVLQDQKQPAAPLQGKQNNHRAPFTQQNCRPWSIEDEESPK